MFKDKTLLITGGTGSFGSAVLKKFINTDIGEIRIFSRDEKKQYDLKQKFNNSKIKFYIGDVRDFSSINFAMKKVDYVFHAAALKQVPTCEFFPMEAIKTNVLGVENVLSSAIQNNIEKIVVLSTDKAVYPVNAMGMSKAMMEKVMVAKSRNHSGKETLMCGTRYGNVMASRGSVIPLFIDQIKSNLPITITDPTMTRFMMSLDEAVQLVLFAFQNAKQGDIFVQKSPAATVEQIALALKKILNSKNEIKIIGTRHGEKKHETLVNREELVRSEDLNNYYRISSDSKGLDEDIFFKNGEKGITSNQDYTSESTSRLNNDELIDLLMKLEVVQNAVRDLVK
jgi:UDP-N-acetylglucosamine 4,6-dehydratase/5-epimerase